jgi:hypothetical protein
VKFYVLLGFCKLLFGFKEIEMNKLNSNRVLGITISILLIITGLKWAPESLEFKDFDSSKLAPLLGSLLFMALLAERTSEVFLTNWRGPTAAQKDREIEASSKEIRVLESAKPRNQNAIVEAQGKLKELTNSREEYRMQTRSAALWLGLLIGLLVSAVGVRVLHELVASELRGTQALYFTAVDILLTGCLISGGSDVLHKIAERYNNFMALSEKKTAEQKQQQATT